MKIAIQLIISLLLSNLCFGQTQISGFITDQTGEPLIGANVFIKDSYDGASTNVDGKYSFKTNQKGDAVLVVSYLGYRQEETPVALQGQTLTLSLVLKETINKMDAVVISAGTFQGGTGTKSEVLKPLDIVTTAGATADIAGALNTLPGTQTVGEEGRLFVRGGSGEETKTFIDGLQVLKPYSTTIPNTPTRGRFSPFMFSGTSFSTGGYSAEYGQALSSALILSTKEKPTQTRTDLSIMTVGAELSHTHSWAKSSLAAQGAYYNMAPYFTLIPQSSDWLKEPESAQTSIAARQLVGNTGMLKFYTNLNSNRFSIYQPDLLDPDKKNLVEVENNYLYVNTSFKNTLGKNWNYLTGLAFTVNTDNINNAREIIGETTKGGHIKSTFSGELNSHFSLNVGGELLFTESKLNYDLPKDDFNYSNIFQNPLLAIFS